MALTEFEQKIINFQAETTTSLAVFAREDEQQTKEIHKINGKLDGLLNPKNGIYKKVDEVDRRVDAVEGQIGTIKTKITFIVAGIASGITLAANFLIRKFT